MSCKNCKEELTQDNVYPSDRRYCADCGQKHALYLQERRQTLASLRDMNLEPKIVQTRYFIRQAVMEFGLDKVYISYSGVEDSTVYRILPNKCIRTSCISFRILPMSIQKQYDIFDGRKKRTARI